MKRFLAILLSAVLFLGLLAACGDKTASIEPLAVDDETIMQPGTVYEDVTGEFTYWSYTDTAANLVASFNAVYPNIKVNLELYSGDEYKTKILTTLQSGKNIPDLFDLEENYAYEFLESDQLEDLGARGFEEKMGDSYSYIVAGGKAPDGTLRGVTFQSSPVGFWYLRDAMEEWVGTSDPAELADMMDSWDSIKTLAQQVKEESGGQVYLWPNIIEMVKVVGYSYEPMVRDGKLEVSGEWMDLLDTMRDYYESGITADLGSWSEQWAAAWNGGDLLIRVMPSWDFFTDEANKGNLGIIKPFENAFEGATIVAMYAGSPNKEAADLFLEFLVGEEWQTHNMMAYNQVPANREVAKEMAKTFSSPDFGGQNLLETYDEINAGVADFTPDRYTRVVQNQFQRIADEGIRAGMSNEQILEALKAQVREDYPEIIIE